MISCVMLATWPNRAAMIEDALLSYDLQDVPDKELVVINDGEPLISRREDVRVFNVGAGQSIGAKRNIGLACSRGEWNATWDDDDFSMPTRLSELRRACLETNSKYARLAGMLVSDTDWNIKGYMLGSSYPTSIVHRDAARRVGGYPDLSWLEDNELYVRLSWRGIPRTKVEAPLYVHRRHATNVSCGTGRSLEEHVARSDQGHAWIGQGQGMLGACLSCRKPDLVAPSRHGLMLVFGYG
jgi:glycosyltransferase involved in cell wall biosynthesis